MQKAEGSKGNGKVTLHKVPELLANSQTSSARFSLDVDSFSLTRRNRKSRWSADLFRVDDRADRRPCLINK